MMFVFSNTCSESPVRHCQDIWKSSHNAVNETSGLYVPYDSSAYGTTRSLSECCEDRYTSSTQNICLSCEVQANVNSTSVCLTSMKSVKQNQQQNLPVALMATTQSSLVLTVQSPKCANHLVCDSRISEMHTTLSPSAVTVCYSLAVVAIIDLVFRPLHCMMGCSNGDWGSRCGGHVMGGESLQIKINLEEDAYSMRVWYYQSTKEKGIQWSVDHTEELNCWNML